MAEPAGEKVPGKHRPLPAEELHPAKQYAPAGHSKHALDAADPMFSLYVPAGQVLHFAVVPLPNVEKLPAPQTPLPLELLQPARQYLPPGQALQDELVPPPAVEKLPAVHAPLPLDELHPARQYAPAGHAKHELNDVDDSMSLYVPAGQVSHIDILDLFPYVPFWHGLHKLVELFEYIPILQSMQSSNTRSWPASHPMYDSDI